MYIKCEIGELLILCAKIHNNFNITKYFYLKVDYSESTIFSVIKICHCKVMRKRKLLQ
jgi:hypothetical protein